MRLLAGVGVEELGNKVSKFGGNLPGSRVGRVKDPGYKVQESGKAGSRILPPVASCQCRVTLISKHTRPGEGLSHTPINSL